MSLFQSTTKLVLFTMVLYASQLSPTTRAEKTPVYVGVQILYDREIYSKIMDTRFLNQYEYGVSPSGYFAAFVEGVELRFRDLPHFRINMTLVNATLIGDDELPEMIHKAPEYGDALNGTETMERLRKAVHQKSQKYGLGDMVFFVTPKYIFTEQKRDEWYGVAKSKGICSSEDKVGLVSDDGKSFNGMEDMAAQAALLLGATRDINNCTKGNHLLSQLYGVRRSDLSSCSKEAIEKFLMEEASQKNCWQTEEEKVSASPAILPSEYHNRTGYDICLYGYSGTRGDVRTCQPEHESERHKRTCRVQCCEYDPRYREPFFLTWRQSADGTPCNTSNICIGGECVQE